MALKDLFAKPAVPDKEPVLRDRSTILAYLEELCRLRTCVVLWTSKDDLLPVGAHIDHVGEETGTLTLSLQRSLPGEIDPRFPIEMLFPLDGMRFRCPVRFKDRGGYMRAIFTVPECVHHAERREKLRTRFGQRENASVTLLESLFRGHAASGKLVNLSLEGLCARLDKAISIEEDRRLAINTHLFHPRQEVMVVRILDLPHAPSIECGGTIMHIEDTPEGVTVGLHLEGLGSMESQTLYQILTRRIPTFMKGFPQKRRRCELELEPTAEDQIVDAVDPADEEVPEAELEQENLETTATKEDSLIRLRKRTRRIMIILRDDLERAILAGTLLADGFCQVKEAQSFAEAFQNTRSSPVDLIFIEQDLGQAPVQEFLAKLRKLGHCEDVPVILISDHSDVKTIIMAKAAHISHIQKLPIDYDGELRGVLYRLLNIA